MVAGLAIWRCSVSFAARHLIELSSPYWLQWFAYTLASLGICNAVAVCLRFLRRIVRSARNSKERSNFQDMQRSEPSPFHRLLALAFGVLKPPPGRARITIAVAYGCICHSVFALAVGAMIVAMLFGMSKSLGRVPEPWSYLANLFLVLQFPILHSFLLSMRGSRLLNWMAPARYAPTLSTTSFAIIASLQLLLLFGLWTPSGIILWRAEGGVFYLLCTLYAFSWLLLIKASYDAGAEVQSGALGWMSLAQDKKPVFPDMPVMGLFRLIRQPIYVSFALTLWTVPVWTPDQLALAVTLTAYCLLAPILKERRFEKRYGARFDAYKASVPYALPRLKSSKSQDIHTLGRPNDL